MWTYLTYFGIFLLALAVVVDRFLEMRHAKPDDRRKQTLRFWAALAFSLLAISKGVFDYNTAIKSKAEAIQRDGVNAQLISKLKEKIEKDTKEFQNFMVSLLRKMGDDVNSGVRSVVATVAAAGQSNLSEWTAAIGVASKQLDELPNPTAAATVTAVQAASADALKTMNRSIEAKLEALRVQLADISGDATQTKTKRMEQLLEGVGSNLQEILKKMTSPVPPDLSSLEVPLAALGKRFETVAAGAASIFDLQELNDEIVDLNVRNTQLSDSIDSWKKVRRGPLLNLLQTDRLTFLSKWGKIMAEAQTGPRFTELKFMMDALEKHFEMEVAADARLNELDPMPRAPQNLKVNSPPR